MSAEEKRTIEISGGQAAIGLWLFWIAVQATRIADWLKVIAEHLTK